MGKDLRHRRDALDTKPEFPRPLFFDTKPEFSASFQAANLG
jgi:hypothetical protein